MKKVSLILPFHNAEAYFAEMLESVRGQTWPNLQLIAVDDGSTDGSDAVFRACEPGLRAALGEVILLRHGENRSASAAVNTALPYCGGDYLCWADADDILLPDSIRKKAEALDRNPELALVRHNGLRFLQGSGKGAELAAPGDKRTQSIFEDLLFGRTYCHNSCYMVRTDAFLACYPDRRIPESRQGQNLQMLLPPASLSDCGYLDDRLFLYRVHEGSHSQGYTRLPELLRRQAEFEDLQLRVLKHCRRDPAVWEAEIRRYWQGEREDLKRRCLDAVRRKEENRR